VTGNHHQASGVEETRSSARDLVRDRPELVARTAEELRAGAEADRVAGTPRGKAYVRRLQALLVERPELGVAAATELGLDHIAEDLLGGTAVEGIPGIGPDGAALTSTPRDRTRRWGKIILAVSTVLLLVEAVTADSLPSIALYLWTGIGLGLFFVGIYLIMVRD
jgi:hypothetical protein